MKTFKTMFPLQNILVGKDFSPDSDQAMDYALDLVRLTNARLHVVYVALPRGYPDNIPPLAEIPDEVFLERLMGSVKNRTGDNNTLDGKALQIEYAIERESAIAQALLYYADVHAVDLIVMGTHGRRGLRRLLLGSVAEEVVRKAMCPVLTTRYREAVPSRRREFKTLLVPIDFSPYSREALRVAKQLAALYQARLDLVHALDFRMPVIPEALEEQLKQFYRTTEGPRGQFVTDVVIDDPASAINRYAAHNGCNLIVMCTHGRTGLDHFLRGSVAEKVVREAPCPVLISKTPQQIATMRQHMPDIEDSTTEEIL